MQGVLAQSKQVVTFVPAKLNECLARREYVGELGDRVSAIEVEYLKSVASIDGQELTRWRDAHICAAGGDRHRRRRALGAQVAFGVGCVAGQHRRPIRCALGDIPK